VNPSFSLSVADVWDRLLEYTDVALVEPRDLPVFKAVHPAWQPVTTINGPDQRNQVNRAVQFGTQLRLATDWKQDSLKELAAYVKEIQRLRSELKDFLLLGECLDPSVVQVKNAADYSAFGDPATGRRACVLVNRGSTPIEPSVLRFVGSSAPEVRVYQVSESPRLARLPVSCTILPGRLAVMIEK
jgi:hypothetical protein